MDSYFEKNHGMVRIDLQKPRLKGSQQSLYRWDYQVTHNHYQRRFETPHRHRHIFLNQMG